MPNFTVVKNPLDSDSLEGLLEIFGSVRSEDLFKVARHAIDLCQRDWNYPGCLPANRRRLATALMIVATLFAYKNER